MSTKAENLMAEFGRTIAQTVRRPGMAAAATNVAVDSGPDKYAGAVRSRAFAELPVAAITCETQLRSEFDEGDLLRLAESLKRYGQLAPIRVRWDEAGARWMVLVGERRLRACRQAGIETVRVELVERPMTDSDILAEQVDTGAIRPTAAYEIRKLATANDQREVARLVVEEGLDHGATVSEVQQRTRTRDPDATRRKAETQSKETQPKGRGARRTEVPGPLVSRSWSASGRSTRSRTSSPTCEPSPTSSRRLWTARRPPDPSTRLNVERATGPSPVFAPHETTLWRWATELARLS